MSSTHFRAGSLSSSTIHNMSVFNSRSSGIVAFCRCGQTDGAFSFGWYLLLSAPVILYFSLRRLLEYLGHLCYGPKVKVKAAQSGSMQLKTIGHKLLGIGLCVRIMLEVILSFRHLNLTFDFERFFCIFSNSSSVLNA